MDTGSDLALQDLLKLRETEVDFLNALRNLIESNWRLKREVADLQGKLSEKEGELTKAKEVIGALTLDVHTLQKLVQTQKSNGKEDVSEQTTHTTNTDLKAETNTDSPAKYTPSPTSIKCLEADGSTRQRPSQEVPADEIDPSEEALGQDCQGDDDSLASDGDGADDDACSDYSPTGEDIHSSSDDGSIYSPSKKRRQGMRARRLCHTCGTCHKSFSRLAALRLHQRKHQKEKNSPRKGPPQVEEERHLVGEKSPLPTSARPHQCRDCGKSFMTASHLKVHHKIHTGEKPYPCSLCEKTFAQKSNVVSHLVSHACKATPVPCPQCQVMFTSSASLRRHIMDHRKENRGVCSKCDLTFISRAELKLHKATHDAERTFACAYCQKAFRNTSGLKDHERTHTGEKPYLCDNCGKSFSCAQHLKTHRRTHTGEKPFTCDECGESFAQGITLRKHRLRHTGEKAHLCALCGKAFARPEVLKTHLRVHSGEKPYGCPQCGQRFGYLQTLQSHQFRMHQKVEGPFAVEMLAGVTQP